MKVLIALVALAAVAVYAVPAKPQDLKAHPFCGVCKDLIKSAENKGEEKAEDYLKREIHTYCAKTGELLADFCEKELDKEVDKLAELVDQKVDPATCCAKVHLC